MIIWISGIASIVIANYIITYIDKKREQIRKRKRQADWDDDDDIIEFF